MDRDSSHFFLGGTKTCSTTSLILSVGQIPSSKDCSDWLNFPAGVTTRGWGYSAKGSRFYWDEDVHEALDQMKSLRGADLEEWKEDMTEDIEQRARVRIFRCQRGRGATEQILP